MTTNDKDIEQPPETFMDIARVCVKKPKKGMFDLLITSVYRLKMLLNYYPTLDCTLSDDKKLLFLISKGLQFKNYKEFREEMQEAESLSYLKDIANIKDYYCYLSSQAKEQNLTLEKTFLRQIQSSILDNTKSLNFLQGFLNTKITEEETKLKVLS